MPSKISVRMGKPNENEQTWPEQFQMRLNLTHGDETASVEETKMMLKCSSLGLINRLFQL